MAKSNKGGGLVPVQQSVSELPPALREKFGHHVDRDAQAASGAGGAFPFISLEGGVFTLLEEELGTEQDVIILDAAHENTYYDTPYVKGERQHPTCFAIGRDQKELAPPADLETRVHDTCKGCTMNEFGSSSTGRGKACGNRVRLVLLPAEGLEAAKVGEIEGARLRVPVTSVKNFSTYTKKLGKVLGRPLFSVVTRLEVAKSKKHAQFELKFSPAGAINDADVLEALEARVREAEDYVMEQPQVASETEEQGQGQPRQRRQKVQRKKAGRKR